MGWVATKRIETAKFTLEPGQALPPSYSAKWIVDHLRAEYGQDALARNDAAGGNLPNASQVAELQSENDRLKNENKQLKARLDALDKARRVAA